MDRLYELSYPQVQSECLKLGISSRNRKKDLLISLIIDKLTPSSDTGTTFLDLPDEIFAHELVKYISTESLLELLQVNKKFSNILKSKSVLILHLQHIRNIEDSFVLISQNFYISAFIVDIYPLFAIHISADMLLHIHTNLVFLNPITAKNLKKMASKIDNTKTKNIKLTQHHVNILRNIVIAIKGRNYKTAQTLLQPLRAGFLNNTNALGQLLINVLNAEDIEWLSTQTLHYLLSSIFYKAIVNKNVSIISTIINNSRDTDLESWMLLFNPQYVDRAFFTLIFNNIRERLIKYKTLLNDDNLIKYLLSRYEIKL